MLLIVNEDGSCMIVSQAYKSWSCDCLLPFKLSQDAGQVAADNDAKNLANRFKILFCDTYFLCNTIVSFLCGSRGVGYQSYLSSVIYVWVFIYLFIFYVPEINCFVGIWSK